MNFGERQRNSLNSLREKSRAEPRSISPAEIGTVLLQLRRADHAKEDRLIREIDAMFAAQIKFPNNANTDQEALVEESYRFMGAWYGNGQIVSDHWPLATTPDGLIAHVLIPATVYV
jgi:hypothetical protein